MKVIFLDLEGTLMQHKSVWRELNRIFGFTKEEEYEHYRQMIAAGEGKYLEWIRLVSDKWMEKSPRKNFFEKFFKYKMVFKEGAKEFIKDLKKKGFRTVLVSYAPEILIKMAAEHLGVDERIAFHNLIFDDSGVLKGVFLKSQPDKLAAVSEYIIKNKLKREHTFAIGDSITDIKMLESVGRGFWMGDFPVLGVQQVDSFGDVLKLL